MRDSRDGLSDHDRRDACPTPICEHRVEHREFLQRNFRATERERETVFAGRAVQFDTSVAKKRIQSAIRQAREQLDGRHIAAAP